MSVVYTGDADATKEQIISKVKVSISIVPDVSGPWANPLSV